MDRKCKINNCDRYCKYKSYCSTHYWQLWKHGEIISGGINKRSDQNYAIEGDVAYIFTVDTRGNRKGAFKIDAEDVDVVIKYKWAYNDNYRYVKSNNCPEKRLHRYLTGAKKGEVVDHINRDPTDNRKSNLRVCSQSTNCINRRIQTNNTTGYRGVVARRGKFYSVVKRNRKTYYVGGSYKTAEEANEARIAYMESRGFFYVDDNERMP